jgi:uncharacterized protein
MKNYYHNRRTFIRTGVLSVAGTLIAKASYAGIRRENELNLKPELKEDKKIITRKLGKTGIVLPVVSMGVMRADNPSLVKTALAKGIVHLDTAHGYQEGRNETMLGALLKDYPRDSFVISTKVHIGGMNDKGEFTADTKPGELLEKLDISLSRLNMDHVDILYVHGLGTRQSVMYKPVIKELIKIKKSGKARFLGVSTHSNMPDVINAAIDAKIYDVVLTSYNYQMKDWKEMNDAVKRASDSGLGVIAMKTMAGGFKNKERTEKVNTKAALKWALQNESIHTAIPGYTSFDQLDESFGVMEDLNLTEQEKGDLFNGEISASLFCQGCQSCAGSCRKKLPVPDLMRAYMYTYGYRDYRKAHEVLLADERVTGSPCSDCDSCTVNCIKGFNISQRIEDVSRLKNIPADLLC